MALQPVEFRLKDGATIAGVEDAGDAGHFTLVFLHEPGGDLDAMLPLAAAVGLSDARKVAIDLPGHGLSSGAFDQTRVAGWLGELIETMRARGRGPFLFVAAGTMAPFALAQADAADTLGLCLVSPRTGGGEVGSVMPRCPILAFVSSSDGAASAEWLAIRSALNSWWMAVSIAIDHADLVAGDGPASSQVASHLQGFARDMYVTSPLLAGRVAAAEGPQMAS